MDSFEKEMKRIIFSELNKDEYKVFLFGSRAVGNYKYNSDYDIGILGKEKLNYTKYLKLKRLLNDLPYIVDLVDFNAVNDDFRNLILKK